MLNNILKYYNLTGLIIYKTVNIGTSKFPEFKGIYLSSMIEDMGLTTCLLKRPVYICCMYMCVHCVYVCVCILCVVLSLIRVWLADNTYVNTVAYNAIRGEKGRLFHFSRPFPFNFRRDSFGPEAKTFVSSRCHPPCNRRNA